MYSDSVQGHGSVLIEVLTETASGVNLLFSLFTFFSSKSAPSIGSPHVLSPRLIWTYRRCGPRYLGLLVAECFPSQHSQETERNFSDALII